MLESFNRTLFQKEVDYYLRTLKIFLQHSDLKDLYHLPIDHLAVKLQDTPNFENYLDSLKPFCQELSYIQMNNRRIATAILNTPFYIEKDRQVSVLEIMEPRPEKVGKTTIGFDHCEIRHTDLASLRQEFKKLKINFEDYANPQHQALVLVIDPKRGWEVKFTDSSLATIVHKQLQTGQSTSLL